MSIRTLILQYFVVLVLIYQNVEARHKKKYILRHIAKKMKIPDHGLAVTHCAAQPCEPNGHCVVDLDEKTGIICFCKPGFRGIRCEHEIEECDQAPCQNKGTCTTTMKGYQCECPEHVTGRHCETRLSRNGEPNVIIVEPREEKVKTVKGTNALIAMIVGLVVFLWLCGCCVCFLSYRLCKYGRKKKGIDPLDFGDPTAIKEFADKAAEEKEKEEEERQKDRQLLLRGGREPTPELPEVVFEGAVSSKLYGDDAIVEKDAEFPGRTQQFSWGGVSEGEERIALKKKE